MSQRTWLNVALIASVSGIVFGAIQENIGAAAWALSSLLWINNYKNLLIKHNELDE